ncbi:MAG: ABC transporter ATP-binding protein [Actinomycetota bacterium]|nr:ABC transporter ATP-binding protein [Actinomycetota bacterium]
MTTYAIEAVGLQKSYGDVRAVESFDLAVPVGSVLGFLGPNGAGKTTVIRMLSTILRPDAGSFTVAGVPSTHPEEIRRRIGVLPESAGYPRTQTGAEWLTFHARLFGQPRAQARATARRLLGEVGLTERADTLVSSYSRGMRQRLGVARALVNDPDVVILDEPTLGLDPNGQRQVLDLVSRIARQRGATVVLSTHQLDEVEQTCDLVLIMHRGHVVAEGSMADVVRRAAAPRQAWLQVLPGERGRAAAVLGSADVQAVAFDHEGAGELQLTFSNQVTAQAAAAGALRLLLDAGVPVLGFTLEGGRLSDAFLSVTEAR